jgi:hypothetical protein
MRTVGARPKKIGKNTKETGFIFDRGWTSIYG